jgi:flagellar motor switch protein FliM
MNSDFLSQEEVDALLSNVTGEEHGRSEQLPPDEVVAYDLAKQERIVRGKMATLEIIHNRAARSLRQSFYNLLRKSPEIEHRGLLPLKYSEWIKNLPLPASFTILQMKGLRGNGLFVLEPGLVFALIDSLFGGSGIKTRIEGRDFSPTEQQIILRVVRMLCETFNAAWRPIMPVEFSQLRHEVHPQFAQIATPSELVVTSSYTVELGDNFKGVIHMCIPYSSLEPIRDLLSNDLQNDSDRDDMRWTSVLSSHVASAGADLRFEIARATMSLSEINNLQVGQFIDLGPAGAPVEAVGYCNGVRLLRGVPGNQNGNFAVRVTGARKLENL